MAKKKDGECCSTSCYDSMCSKICPIVLFLVALLWLLNDLGIFVTNLPWLPIFAVLFTLKMIIRKYSC